VHGIQRPAVRLDEPVLVRQVGEDRGDLDERVGIFVLRAGDRVSKLRLLVEAGQVARDASLDLDSAPVIGVCFDKLGAFAAA